MISQKNISDIENRKKTKCYKKTIPYLVFLSCFLCSLALDLSYNESTNLVNDKLIDVSSIFFGIFIGSIYLFEKFKKEDTYQDFLKFCKILISLNLLIIALSFVIILVDDYVSKFVYQKAIKELDIMVTFKADTILFSIYLGLFGVTIYFIKRYLNTINIILTSKKEENKTS